MKGSILFVLFSILVVYSQFSIANTLDDNFERGRIAYIAGDYRTAKKELITAANQGHQYAQSFLGIMYYNGEGVRQNYKEALKWFRFAAKQGCKHAEGFLGSIYYDGKGVHQNYHEAFKWNQLAAKKGESTSQCMLGFMYQNGEGIRQDKVRAKEWFGKSCDNGCQIGCNEYRKMNEAGY